MSRKLVLAVVLLVVLAGCSGAGSGGDASEATNAEATYTEAATDGGGGGGANGDGGGDDSGGVQLDSGSDTGRSLEARAKVQTRYRIKTARIRLEVDTYDDARNRLVSETRSLGGYVDSETSDRHTRGNETWKTGTIVLRVPSENYDQVIAAVEASGTVLHKETDSRDVTERVVDLRAQLKNLRAQRDRLRDLYESANDTEAILQVGQRLSEVQGEIERIEGKLQVLENQVAYSTVRVQLREQPPEGEVGPETVAWYETGVIAAFVESVNGVVVVGRMLVVGVAYVAPYAMAFGIPVAGLYVVARRFS